MSLQNKLMARFNLEALGTAYTWDVMKPKYDKILQTYKILKFNEAEQTAAKLIPNIPIYRAVSNATNVPITWLAAIHIREASGNFNAYFGNGDPLHAVTRHVPAGRGPFGTWAAGTLDSLHQMGLVGLAAWTLDFYCYQSERFNGFGYEMHNEISPYVVGGTSLQTIGKYDADGHFNSRLMDPQLGTLAIYAAMIAQIPDLAIPIYG